MWAWGKKGKNRFGEFCQMRLSQLLYNRVTALDFLYGYHIHCKLRWIYDLCWIQVQRSVELAQLLGGGADQPGIFSLPSQLKLITGQVMLITIKKLSVKGTVHKI